MPDRVAAEGKKTIFQIAFGGIDPRDHEQYAFYETIAGGYGARPTKDGEDAVQAHYQNTENSPVEELEGSYPVMILGYELVPDSEGPGRHRGGLGLRRTYRFKDHAPVVTILADTARFAPRGLSSGLDGRTARFLYYADDLHPVPITSKCTFRAESNSMLVVETPGGGGYGSPYERDPESVLRDVRDGKVSPERALSAYGVFVDTERWVADTARTADLRE
jgi:N-methylhydantoinase B